MLALARSERPLAAVRRTSPGSAVSRPQRISKLSRRSYAKQDGSGEKGSANDRDDSSARTNVKGPPGKPSTSAINVRSRDMLSVLSPLKKVTLGLGKSGIVVFAGPISKHMVRYSSWPFPHSCRIVPGGGPPMRFEEDWDFTGDLTIDLKNMARAAQKQKDKLMGTLPVVDYWARGDPQWLVSVGDELKPEVPFLKVGQVEFIHQPKRKPPHPNPPLYVANILLEGYCDGVDPGTPLLVAVDDLNHLTRLKDYSPSDAELSNLKMGRSMSS